TLAGCDSITTLTLIVGDYIRENISESICHGSSYTFGNRVLTEGGTYADTTQTLAGCDSITTLTLTVEDYIREDISESICHGGSYQFGGRTLTEGGTYADTTRTLAGCDSITTLTLTVEDYIRENISESICHGGSFTFGSRVLTEGGIYADTTRTLAGCDSITTLTLTVNQPSFYTDFQTACDSYTWINGITYTESIDTTTITLTNSVGCDSIITLHLTISHGTTGIDEHIACESYTWIDGRTFYESTDTATYHTTNAAGCDSVVTLHLTIYHPQHTADSQTACESYTWHGQTYTTSDTYYYPHTDAHGCTQVDTLYLTINHPQHTSTTQVACESYTWHGQTHTTSGTYYYTHDDIHGCTQVDTLYLTINHPHHTASTEIACDSLEWYGQVYHTSGTYLHDHNDENGCSQVDTLHLTINHNSASELTIVECESYTWNTTTYNESGDYTQTFTNAAGCDSIVTLHLTINHPQNIAANISACEEYEWNGTTYTTSGSYTFLHEDANGCTQVDTLYLTVNFPTHTAFSEYACHPYEWNGQYYSSTGTYTFAHEDANGCEQVDTLHLNYITDTTTTLFSHTFNFCDQEQAVLEVSSSLPNIEWSTGETSPIITVFESGTYFVTASQGQCVINREYTIKPCEYKIHLPNAFTANGDGLNDVFCIPEGYLEQIDDNDFEVYIYDRWGEIVFFSNRKDFRWNGEIKGRVLKNYTYTYLIKYVSASGIPGMIRGSVIVL
ncbi:MAG: gliding motility-associated C-terminal domain-containing protein, partial [Bacteroidales bacterium]|nr:gliding motility-associated C-terminal domain-containing protein [Bacteroidales bacterium]